MLATYLLEAAASRPSGFECARRTPPAALQCTDLFQQTTQQTNTILGELDQALSGGRHKATTFGMDRTKVAMMARGIAV
jgi:hypothetical protein